MSFLESDFNWNMWNISTCISSSWKSRLYISWCGNLRVGTTVVLSSRFANSLHKSQNTAHTFPPENGNMSRLPKGEKQFKSPTVGISPTDGELLIMYHHMSKKVLWTFYYFEVIDEISKKEKYLTINHLPTDFILNSIHLAEDRPTLYWF